MACATRILRDGHPRKRRALRPLRREVLLASDDSTGCIAFAGPRKPFDGYEIAYGGSNRSAPAQFRRVVEIRFLFRRLWIRHHRNLTGGAVWVDDRRKKPTRLRTEVTSHD